MPTIRRMFDDQFAFSTARAVVPIAIWSVHFFIAYWAVQGACQLGWSRHTFAGIAWITIVLWVLTATAIGALIVLIMRDGRRIRGKTESEGVLMFVQVGIAIFALIGVGWSAVPILVTAPCGSLY